MATPLPTPELLEEWLCWAVWINDPNRNEGEAQNQIGFSEFDWVVQEYPEQAWQAILAAVRDLRFDSYLPNLAAGPLEDLLSRHGSTFIERVEAQAAKDPKFAWLLGGVWQHTMPDSIWSRVNAVWDRRGWDGIPKNGD